MTIAVLVIGHELAVPEKIKIKLTQSNRREDDNFHQFVNLPME